MPHTHSGLAGHRSQLGDRLSAIGDREALASRDATEKFGQFRLRLVGVDWVVHLSDRGVDWSNLTEDRATATLLARWAELRPRGQRRDT